VLGLLAVAERSPFLDNLKPLIHIFSFLCHLRDLDYELTCSGEVKCYLDHRNLPVISLPLISVVMALSPKLPFRQQVLFSLYYSL